MRTRQRVRLVAAATFFVTVLVGPTAAVGAPARAAGGGTAATVVPAAIAPLVAALVTPARPLGHLGDVSSGVTAANWRTRLAPLFADMPGMRAVTSLPATPVQGAIFAASLTLPDTIELSGDTTIVVSTLVFTHTHLRVIGHAHAINLYPVDAVTSTDASGPNQQAGGSAPSCICKPPFTYTIDTSGAAGQAGQGGNSGYTGMNGFSGYNGYGEWDGPSGCFGQDGGDGDGGQMGSFGGAGLGGTAGASAQDITLSLPVSQNHYILIARGGGGGAGGAGGTGGDGGAGGDGGYGSSADPGCWPGDGGNGGSGGDGAPGGIGGPGNDGGSGGHIVVTYPAGFLHASISADVSHGAGGAAGVGGTGGTGGRGGSGGVGGESIDPFGGFAFGEPGAPGSNGDTGTDGSAGYAGNPGSVGTVSITAV